MLGLLALAAFQVQLPTAPMPVEPPPRSVHAFYYGWYGNPAHDGAFVHWQQGGHLPPVELGADYRPLLGAYSSRDRAVLDRHFGWFVEAGIGVAVVSYWGPGSREDQLLPGILDAAARAHVEVAFHIEPYAGRTAATVVRDIRDLRTRFGSHPAFHRVARPTRHGPSHAPRGVFYVFESSGGGGRIPDADWARELATIRGTADDAIVLGQALDVNRLDQSQFDGLYNYDVFAVDGSGFDAVGRAVRQRNAIFVPSVGPGYVDGRAIPGSTRSLGRDAGARYDLMWARAVDARAEWVSITSFNEWHEGSQIEPAVRYATPSFTCLDYTDTPGARSPEGRDHYLRRTSAWSERFVRPGRPRFATSFESLPFPFANRIESRAHVDGATPGSMPTCTVASTQSAPGTGFGPLLVRFAGHDTSATADSYCWFRLFDLDLGIEPGTSLRYRLFRAQGTEVGVDLVLDDGSRVSASARDQHGRSIRAADGTDGPGAWRFYEVDLSRFRGRRITAVLCGYDDATAARTGPFEAFLDVVEIVRR